MRNMGFVVFPPSTIDNSVMPILAFPAFGCVIGQDEFVVRMLAGGR